MARTNHSHWLLIMCFFPFSTWFFFFGYNPPAIDATHPQGTTATTITEEDSGGTPMVTVVVTGEDVVGTIGGKGWGRGGYCDELLETDDVHPRFLDPIMTCSTSCCFILKFIPVCRPLYFVTIECMLYVIVAMHQTERWNKLYRYKMHVYWNGVGDYELSRKSYRY
jgi:hypothetical protein